MVNGAGKSTFKAHSGQTKHLGSLEIAGEVHAVLTLGVGLQEELTGRENLYLEAEVHNTNSWRRSNNRRYDYICGFKRIHRQTRENLFLRYEVATGVHKLSFVEPEILLLDENFVDWRSPVSKESN